MERTMQIRNPIYSASDNSRIDCEIEHPVHGWIPFTADPNDVEPLGKEVFDSCIAGDAGPVGDYVAPITSAASNKAEAERRLAATDWVNQPDVYDPANTPHLTNRDVFIAYRSQIRGIAVNPVAGNLDWPSEPSAVWSS
jgi:transglutaminase-like putative cysteine protease